MGGWLLSILITLVLFLELKMDYELNGANPASGSPLAGKLFVVMGVGGAGKSLAYGAKQKGARVVVVNRTYERAKELADKVDGQTMTLAEVENFHPEEGMILANTTSVGMKPKIDDTPIPNFQHHLHTKRYQTLGRSKRVRRAIVYGTEILICQGFEQYKNFTGLPAPEALFRELMEKHA